ncbi:MAG: flagellar export protein FliJ [Firmicutes bacterium]|nr:flagellar export protein FliJ [Bacillota bacterium]
MRRWRFELQRVLDVRRIREEERRQQLARAQAEWTVVARRLDGVRAERHKAVEAAVSGAFDVSWRIVGWSQRARLFSRMRALEDELAERERDRDEVREQLVQAARERQVLERLAERRRAAFLLEEGRREQALLDDMVAARLGRREASRWGLPGR